MWKKIDVDSSGSLDETEFVRAVTPYVDQVRREREASIDRSGSVERGLSKPMWDPLDYNMKKRYENLQLFQIVYFMNTDKRNLSTAEELFLLIMETLRFNY